MHGGQGFGEKNELENTILDFAFAFYLVIANACFKKREQHLITYKCGTSKSQINLFLVRKHNRLAPKDCKVILGESLTTQHKLVVLDICNRNRRSRIVNKMCLKTRWRDLKGKKSNNIYG